MAKSFLEIQQSVFQAGVYQAGSIAGAQQDWQTMFPKVTEYKSGFLLF